MSAARLFRYAYLAYVAKPQADRLLYRFIRRNRVRSIVELGIGDARRTRRLIDLASRFSDQQIRYTGVDLFEARADATTGLIYKNAHHLLKKTEAKVRLIPGDPLTALSRAANDLLNTDLMVIAADQEQDSLAKAWFYVPRMLTSNSVVCLEESNGKGETRFRVLTPQQVDGLAGVDNTPLTRAA